MAEYRFTEQAERDLEVINDYSLQHWNARQAHGYLDGLEARCQLLADNPKLGVNRKSIYEGLFSFPYESYVLYYVSESHAIAIVRVLHHSMDPLKHL